MSCKAFYLLTNMIQVVDIQMQHRYMIREHNAISRLVVRSFSWAVAGPGAKKDGCFRRRFYNPAFDRLLPFSPNSSFSKVACQTRVEANSYVNCKQSLFCSKISREKQGKEGL